MTSKTQKDLLSHHAYLIVGGQTERQSLIERLGTSQKIATNGNPDFFDRQYETFTIDDAREIKSHAETRPVGLDDKKVFLLVMNAITLEAQNALLKILEEPGEYVHFFLIIPSAHLLIPTVKSRLSLWNFGAVSSKASHIKKDESKQAAIHVKKFIESPLKSRLDMIKVLMDDIGKDKKTKQDALSFLNDLEDTLHAEGVIKRKDALQAILHARTYATDRAPSIKMLLEYVAMNLS